MSNRNLPPELVAKMYYAVTDVTGNKCAQIAVDYADSYRQISEILAKDNDSLKQQRDELIDCLEEVKEFLGHIQPKIGKQAFNEIWDTVEESLNIENNER